MKGNVKRHFLDPAPAWADALLHGWFSEVLEA